MNVEWNSRTGLYEKMKKIIMFGLIYCFTMKRNLQTTIFQQKLLSLSAKGKSKVIDNRSFIGTI